MKFLLQINSTVTANKLANQRNQKCRLMKLKRHIHQPGKTQCQVTLKIKRILLTSRYIYPGVGSDSSEVALKSKFNCNI